MPIAVPVKPPTRQAPSRTIEALAGVLQMNVGLLVRRLRQRRDGDGPGGFSGGEGDVTMPEISALARLDRGGPMTASELAKIEQISPQSMGATLAALDVRGLVGRRPDPGDGRRIVISVSDAGMEVLRRRRRAKAQQIASALASGFTAAEIEQLRAAMPLLERLAQNV